MSEWLFWIWFIPGLFTAGVALGFSAGDDLDGIQTLIMVSAAFFWPFTIFVVVYAKLREWVMAKLGYE